MTSGDRENERLTALGGLAALSLDALSSVAYGPEAILVVLVTAGTAALRYSMPVTVAIVVLLAALMISYRQVIEAFPNGGGAYAVSQRHLGRVPSLVAAASLIVDYVLNAAVGVSAGVEALTAAFPVAVRRARLDLPGGARPDHRGEHVGGRGGGADLHGADDRVHRRDLPGDHRRADPRAPGGRPVAHACRRPPTPWACCSY